MGCPADCRAERRSQPVEPDPDHAGGGRDALRATRDDLPILPPICSTRLRARRPRVHCITNSVAQTFTANVLLAVGCVPSMTIRAGGDRRLRRGRGCAAGQSRHLRSRAPRGDRDRGRSRDAGQPALGARSGVHRSLRPARGLRQRAARARTQGDAAQSRRILRAGGQRADARSARRLRARARNRGRAHWRDRSGRRRRAARASPTVIR